MSHTKSAQIKLLNRVKKIRGQIDRVDRTLASEDHDCAEVLMLLATACMMPSAFSRIPLDLTFMVSNFASILIMFNVFVMVCALIDTVRNRRLHPAFGWGGVIVIGALNLAYLIAISPAWLRFGVWLVS